MTAMTAAECSRLGILGQPVRSLDELPPITDSGDTLEQQFSRAFASIPKPEAPHAPAP